MTFKNALCLAGLPDGGNHLSPRYRSCQRLAGHDGVHQTWKREWSDGDRESRPRCSCGEAMRAIGVHGRDCAIRMEMT